MSRRPLCFPVVQMQILLNGDPRVLDGPCTVAALLEQLGLPSAGVAVERNRAIVTRADWAKTWLEDGDELEVVTLVGGG